MTVYAVMKTGGKEYRVAAGDVVRVGKLAAAPGVTVEIREVSSIETDRGVTVGSPTVVDARVIAEVIEEGHGERILVFKKKRRDHYQMMTGDLKSYTALRIREIVMGPNAHMAAAAGREVAAAATPPPPPPRITEPERKVAEPQASKAPPRPMPSAPPSPSPIELVPSVAAQDDSPIHPNLASEKPASTQPQAPSPSREAVRPVHAVQSPPSRPSSTEMLPTRFAPPLRLVTEAPAPPLAEERPRKRTHAITALVAGLMVIAAGLVFFGSREPRAPGQAAVEVVTVAAPAQAAESSAPPPAAKPAPRKELAVKTTAAANAPSAPVQPPE